MAELIRVKPEVRELNPAGLQRSVVRFDPKDLTFKKVNIRPLRKESEEDAPRT